MNGINTYEFPLSKRIIQFMNLHKNERETSFSYLLKLKLIASHKDQFQ